VSQLNREDYEFRYKLFDRFALADQRNYYVRTTKKHRKALSQVNFMRALLAFFTAVSSALAGLLIVLNFTTGKQCFEDYPAGAGCEGLQLFIYLLIIMSIVMPAFGGFFTSLADLYQWNRLISIYDSAVENIEVADALSPLDAMDQIEYRASLRAYAEGTLQVMSDETAQWGQSIRTPRSMEEFIEAERKKAAEYGGDADAGRDSADS